WPWSSACAARSRRSSSCSTTSRRSACAPARCTASKRCCAGTTPNRDGWRRRGLPPLRVAVNISPPELRRRDVAREILEVVGDLAGTSPWGIDIEITEGALGGDSSSCVHALRLLRAGGLNIAIDDFGTGYSSLGRLSELPIDTLKIDRSFTSRLPTDRKCCTLVASIIALAHAFDLSTVAEGVESQAQFDHLLRAGCDESQGYFHSRPLPAA